MFSEKLFEELLALVEKDLQQAAKNALSSRKRELEGAKWDLDLHRDNTDTSDWLKKNRPREYKENLGHLSAARDKYERAQARYDHAVKVSQKGGEKVAAKKVQDKKEDKLPMGSRKSVANAYKINSKKAGEEHGDAQLNQYLRNKLEKIYKAPSAIREALSEELVSLIEAYINEVSQETVDRVGDKRFNNIEKAKKELEDLEKEELIGTKIGDPKVIDKKIRNKSKEIENLKDKYEKFLDIESKWKKSKYRQ